MNTPQLINKQPSYKRAFLLLSGLFVLVVVGFGTSHQSLAHSQIPNERNRYYNHGQIRLVEPRYENKRIVLYWRSPSGKNYRYEPYRHHKGWMARLRRAMQDNVRYIGVGGRYSLTHSKGGRVWITLVRRVWRVFRGVRPVKIDGKMPIYTATVLPRHKNDRAYVYKLWGQVNLYQTRYVNSLACLYGEWFDFQGRSLGLVSQILGFKGRAIQSFPEQYRVPVKKWSQLWRRRKRLLRYQEAWRLGQQPKLPSKVLPVLPYKKTESYYKQCNQRLEPWQRKSVTPIDILYQTPVFRPAFFPYRFPSKLFGLPGTPLTGYKSTAYWSKTNQQIPSLSLD